MSTSLDALIHALSGTPNERESAIARLIILGPRAVGRLVAAYDADADRERRIAILRVLEASGDDRGLAAARTAVASGGDVAIAGVSVLRELLMRGTGSVHAEALDLLLGVAKDTAAERRVRAAALQAFDGAPEDIRRVVGSLAPMGSAEDEAWRDAVEGRLPDNPAALGDVVESHATASPLPVLRRLVEACAARERAAGHQPDQDAWRSVRGALHQALALRDSRVALYDLRETIAAANGPLPHSFVAALHAIGDATCLEPIAEAVARGASADGRWRQQLAQAFREIVRRERITRRTPALRRALLKSPELGQ